MLTFDDAFREFVSPKIPTDHNVSALASGGAWATLTPPSTADAPAGNFNSYDLVVEGASAAYEVTWKPSPAVGDRGITVPANTPMTFTRVATPYLSTAVGWPSFRAIGATPITIRMQVHRSMV